MAQWVKSWPAVQETQADVSLIPGLGRSSEGGHGNPLQYSCLENPMNRGAWWATVHRVAKESDNTEVTEPAYSRFLLQGIFSTQGSNPGLLHCRQILYHLSHQGSTIFHYICIYIYIYTHTYNILFIYPTVF